MALQTINNGDSGLVARAKINAAIDAINAMTSTTTTSTSTTTSPTTTSSTTSTSTTTSSTTTSSSTTSQTVYKVTNCNTGMFYYITTITPLTFGWAYKLISPATPFDGSSCWEVTEVGSASPAGYTYVSAGTSYTTCTLCNGDTTTTSSTTYPTTTSSTSTTTYVPPPTTTMP